VLKLDAALLLNNRLLNRVHLAFELGEFCGGRAVATDKERRRPEDDNCRSGPMTPSLTEHAASISPS
jgi:hypothetical protein